MNNYFILLAAGNGRRFGSKIPKQFTIYRGKMMYEHSIYKAIKSKLFKKIILVINSKHKKFIKDPKNKKIVFVLGGNERFKSSINALKYIKKFHPKRVFIHDAARPNFKISLLKKLNKYLGNNKSVIPYNNPINSIKLKSFNEFKNINKNDVFETQTPQCFDYKLIYKLSIKNSKKIPDECTLLIENDHKVKFVKGDETNKKITYKNSENSIFYGLGFDIHRLVRGKKLFLGGLKIKSNFGTLGHSDGDPVLHSITDSILGACSMKDIGQKFSDKKKQFKNIRSTILLKKVVNEIKEKNFIINNIDINIICQKPKIQNYKQKMIKIISKICEIDTNRINIKGKTTEKLGIIGKELAIACEVITSVIKYD